jgi:hypothetical protein
MTKSTKHPSEYSKTRKQLRYPYWSSKPIGSIATLKIGYKSSIVIRFNGSWACTQIQLVYPYLKYFQ